MRDRRRHTWTAWIAIWAFLLSGIWPSLAFGNDQVPPFGDDVCSASRTSDRSAPVAPAHTHKHCDECVIGAALQFGAPPRAEPIWVAESASRFSPRPLLQRVVSVPLVVATSPRGPPALV